MSCRLGLHGWTVWGPGEPKGTAFEDEQTSIHDVRAMCVLYMCYMCDTLCLCRWYKCVCVGGGGCICVFSVTLPQYDHLPCSSAPSLPACLPTYLCIHVGKHVCGASVAAPCTSTGACTAAWQQSVCCRERLPKCLQLPTSSTSPATAATATAACY